MSRIWKYFIKRFVMFISVVIVAMILNFLIPRLSPGNPVQGMITAMERHSTGVENAEEILLEFKKRFGLDKDWLTQFILYVEGIFNGDLGYSVTYFPTKVNWLIGVSLPYTLGLLSVSIISSWLLGSLIGTILGWRSGKSKVSRIVAILALGLYAMPYYILALILVFLLSFSWRIFPSSGAWSLGVIGAEMTLSKILDYLWHLALPVLSILLSSLGWWILSMRSMMVTLKGEDFILMAEAKGLSRQRIMWGYAFRNTLLPQATALALALGGMVGGSIVTEIIFSYPGIGTLLFSAITNADYPVIQGVTLIITLSVCATTFIMDLMYPLIDPRVAYE